MKGFKTKIFTFVSI